MGSQFMQPALRSSGLAEQKDISSPQYVGRAQGISAAKYIQAANTFNQKPPTIPKRSSAYPKTTPKSF